MGKDQNWRQNTLNDNHRNETKEAKSYVVCPTAQGLLSLKHKMVAKLKKQRVKNTKDTRSQLKQKFKAFIGQRQNNYEQNGSSSCQFTCPICLEMLMSPCPTTCGHIFCYRCIDESIIRNGNCPSCRNFIRNEQFTESKPFEEMCHYFWMTSKQKNTYLEKLKKNQEWIKGRRLDVNTIKINQFIDVRDTEYIWCKAKILDIYRGSSKTELLVHFEGWNDIYNEVINVKSQRLAPYNFFSRREDIPRYRLSSPEDNMRSRIEYRDFRDRAIDRDRETNNIRELFLAVENSRRGINQNRFIRWRPNENSFIEQFLNVRPIQATQESQHSASELSRQSEIQEEDEQNRREGEYSQTQQESESYFSANRSGNQRQEGGRRQNNSNANNSSSSFPFVIIDDDQSNRSDRSRYDDDRNQVIVPPESSGEPERVPLQELPQMGVMSSQEMSQILIIDQDRYQNNPRARSNGNIESQIPDRENEISDQHQSSHL